MHRPTSRHLLPRVLVSACAAAIVAAACTPSAPGSAPTTAPAATSAPAPTAAPKPAASAAPVGASPAAAPSAAPAASASASPPGLASVPKTPVETVKFATTTGSSTSAGVYIAQERGYFKQVGLNVDIVGFGGGAQMISSVAASQVDIANTDAGAGLINAMARNVPIRFVADGSRCIPGKCNSGLVVRKDLVDSGKFKSVADLKGMTVNTFSPGSTINMFLYRTLEKNGLKPSDIKTAELDNFTDIIPALTTKRLDATFLIEPFITLAASQGVAVKYQDTAQLLGAQQATIIVYSPNFASKHQEAGKRFAVAYLRGLRDFVDAFTTGKDKAQIVSILTKDTTLKNPALWNNVPQWFDPNGSILLDQLIAAQQWYQANGYVKTPIDFNKAWDPTYTDYALSVLGKQ